MTREEIEKAAREYSDVIWNNDRARDISKIAYFVGAQWRINSVWHNNSVRPGEDCNVLVETKRGIELDRYDIDYNELDNGTDWETEVIRWAYVEDLLPDGKEATE